MRRGNASTTFSCATQDRARSRVYRLLRKGEVRVNRKRVDAEYRIQEGDEVRLPRCESTRQ